MRFDFARLKRSDEDKYLPSIVFFIKHNLLASSLVETLPNPRHKIQDIFLFFRVSTPICVYRIRESSLLSKFNMAELQYNGIRVYDKGEFTIRALVQRLT
jgi:hypothetical protein